MRKANSSPKESAKAKPSCIWLDELSTEEADGAAKAEKVVILPVGSVEEHGNHLPLCTDSLQPEYVARKVAKKTGCLIAPPIRYGICNAARNFPGTISLEFNSLLSLIRDILAELARNGFNKIIVVSGHAGSSHMTALRLAAQQVVLQNESKANGKKIRIMVLSDYDFAGDLKTKYALEEDGHAGTIETSRMMDIMPKLVKSSGKASFPKMPRFEIVAHPEHFFPSGVIGDPTIASAKKGHEINKYIIDEVAKLVRELEK